MIFFTSVSVSCSPSEGCFLMSKVDLSFLVLQKLWFSSFISYDDDKLSLHTPRIVIGFCLLSFICPTCVRYFQPLHNLWHTKPTPVHITIFFIIFISLPHLFPISPNTFSCIEIGFLGYTFLFSYNSISFCLYSLCCITSFSSNICVYQW